MLLLKDPYFNLKIDCQSPVNVDYGVVIWKKADLPFTQDAVFNKEGQYLGIDIAAENLSQITAHTNALVVVRC